MLFRQLQQLGLPLRESGGYYGYSLALGSAEVPLLHLTNAYRALANAGRYSPVAPYQVQTHWQPEAVQVISPQTAFIVGTCCRTHRHALAPLGWTVCWQHAFGLP